MIHTYTSPYVFMDKCLIKRGIILSGPDYGSSDPSRWPRDTLYPQKLAPASPTSGDRLVGIVRSPSFF
jgi:hypothetical protein